MPRIASERNKNNVLTPCRKLIISLLNLVKFLKRTRYTSQTTTVYNVILPCALNYHGYTRIQVDVHGLKLFNRLYSENGDSIKLSNRIYMYTDRYKVCARHGAV
jgi:hypothetical protein